jgi:hypothetical protein
MLVSLVTWSPGLYSGAENSLHWFPHRASEIASVTRPLLVISRLLGVTLGRIFCSNTHSATPEQQNYSRHDSAWYTSYKTVFLRRVPLCLHNRTWNFFAFRFLPNLDSFVNCLLIYRYRYILLLEDMYKELFLEIHLPYYIRKVWEVNQM